MSRFHTPIGHEHVRGFTTARGDRLDGACIADEAAEAGAPPGSHIFKQLEACGLREMFEKGSTPDQLPYSFPTRFWCGANLNLEPV